MTDETRRLTPKCEYEVKKKETTFCTNPKYCDMKKEDGTSQENPLPRCKKPDIVKMIFELDDGV